MWRCVEALKSFVYWHKIRVKSKEDSMVLPANKWISYGHHNPLLGEDVFLLLCFDNVFFFEALEGKCERFVGLELNQFHTTESAYAQSGDNL